MITDAIINIIFLIPYGLLSAMDSLNIELSLPADMFEIIKDLTVGVNYVVPIERLMPIFVVMISLSVFKIVWAIVIRVKSFIPTMGS